MPTLEAKILYNLLKDPIVVQKWVIRLSTFNETSIFFGNNITCKYYITDFVDPDFNREDFIKYKLSYGVPVKVVNKVLEIKDQYDKFLNLR